MSMASAGASTVSMRRAHGADGADDLVDRLAAHAQRHQEAADLRRRRFAGHDDLEGGARILAVERLSRCGLGDKRLQIRHAGLSFALPLLRQRQFGELLVDRHTVALLQLADHLIENIVAAGLGDGIDLPVVIVERVAADCCR